MIPYWTAGVAYLLGSIPFGVLIVKMRGGPDIRQSGSGNIGAANVMRNAGAAAGVLTLVLDAGKGYLAVWIAERGSYGSIRWMVIAAAAAVIGHIFPVWLQFRGGKGVATSSAIPADLPRSSAAGGGAVGDRGGILAIFVAWVDCGDGGASGVCLFLVRAGPRAAHGCHDLHGRDLAARPMEASREHPAPDCRDRKPPDVAAAGLAVGVVAVARLDGEVFVVRGEMNLVIARAGIGGIRRIAEAVLVA